MLAASDGLMVHRSWWVAREAVLAIERQNRRHQITLTNGQVVPVSRAGSGRLKQAAWD